MKFRGLPRGVAENITWDRKDQTYHEPETLTEVVMPGGTHDQLNMPLLMSFEKVSQRLQVIVEAHAEVGQASSWKMARYFDGVH